VWMIEESKDCGVHWWRAELTYGYAQPDAAMREAFEIIACTEADFDELVNVLRRHFPNRHGGNSTRHRSAIGTTSR
jgi:hypothetical protein